MGGRWTRTPHWSRPGECLKVLRELIRDARMYMSKMRAHTAKDEQCPKGMGRALDWTCMLKVVASVAADGDRECSLSRQAARLYILARYEHIIPSAQSCDVSSMQNVIHIRYARKRCCLQTAPYICIAEAKTEAQPTSMRRPKLMPWASSRADMSIEEDTPDQHIQTSTQDDAQQGPPGHQRQRA